jgi:hypothetical protein
VFGIFSAFPKISRHYLTDNELDLEDCINEGTVQHMTLTEAMMILWMRMEMIPHSNEGTSALLLSLSRVLQHNKGMEIICYEIAMSN